MYEEIDYITDNFGKKWYKRTRSSLSFCPDWRSFGERIAYTNPYAPRDICNIHGNVQNLL